MRDVGGGPKNKIGLDFEENLEGFIRFLSWLSVVSYTPVFTVMAGVMAGAMFRAVRLKTAGRIFAMLFALNWLSLRWLERRFLSPPRKR